MIFSICWLKLKLNQLSLRGQTDIRTPHDGNSRAYAQHRAAIKLMTHLCVCVRQSYRNHLRAWAGNRRLQPGRETRLERFSIHKVRICYIEILLTGNGKHCVRPTYRQSSSSNNSEKKLPRCRCADDTDHENHCSIPDVVDLCICAGSVLTTIHH